MEKLVERVRVETYLVNHKCFNKECDGNLVADGHTRPENGLHGGAPEYRHKCSRCSVGFFSKVKYPQVEYKEVPVVVETIKFAEPRLDVKKSEAASV